MIDPTKYTDRMLWPKTSEKIDARVTIIAADGTVLGDTWENPATMENHATRPEVKAALASGIGEDHPLQHHHSAEHDVCGRHYG